MRATVTRPGGNRWGVGHQPERRVVSPTGRIRTGRLSNWPRPSCGPGPADGHGLPAVMCRSREAFPAGQLTGEVARWLEGGVEHRGAVQGNYLAPVTEAALARLSASIDKQCHRDTPDSRARLVAT